MQRISINDRTITQVEQRADIGVAMRSPLGVVNRRLEVVTPIIVVIDEAQEVDLKFLHVRNTNPELFNNDLKLDNTQGYDIFPSSLIPDVESMIWELDLEALKRTLDRFDATDSRWWRNQHGQRKPNLRLIVLQPESDPYIAVGKLPSRGITDGAEWGALPMPQRVLVKQNGISEHTFNDVQVSDNHNIFYRRVKVPIAMEDIRDPITREFLYKIPAAKWTAESLGAVVPGGFSPDIIDNLNLNPNATPTRPVWVSSSTAHGWFLPIGGLGFIPQRSAWLGIADDSDTSRPRRSPLRAMFDALGGGNSINKVDINVLPGVEERWIRALDLGVSALMANSRSVPFTKELVGSSARLDP